MLAGGRASDAWQPSHGAPPPLPAPPPHPRPGPARAPAHAPHHRPGAYRRPHPRPHRHHRLRPPQRTAGGVLQANR